MKKKEEQAFDSIIDIDKTRLDDECENHPRHVWIYSKMHAKAIRKLSVAVAAVKVVEADVDSMVREDPTDYGLEKVTEAGVKKAILRSKEYQDVQAAVVDAEYRVNMLNAANKTLEHRRSAMTMLNSQDERNYFARPKQKERTDTGKSQHRKAMRTKQ